MKTVRKAVFPVAGLGSRFLPATKACAKEMLPIVDKPLIQYAVEEAFAAGITDMIFVTGRNKRSIEDHFDRATELEADLESKSRDDLLRTLRGATPDGINCIYIRQSAPLGLGHAVLCARPIVGDEPFAVILPDDLMDARTPVMTQLVAAFDHHHSSILAIEAVPREQTRNYGIVSSRPIDERDEFVTGIVEKPDPDMAPSCLAVVGRYILVPEIFDMLEQVKPGRNNEIQLTDGIADLIRQQHVIGHRFEGKRYDCGSKIGYLKANVAYGMRHEEVGDEFRAFLESTTLPGVPRR